MCEPFPDARMVLAQGRKGGLYVALEKSLDQPAESVKAIDTKASGDTFIGFFLTEFMETGDVKKKRCNWGVVLQPCVSAGQERQIRFPGKRSRAFLSVAPWTCRKEKLKKT